ncbi:MAG: FAD-dependent oxidoreductase [Proteobacteria bacterium]|nr:FAD-dependent oxidoreductase [Pseudomonadota bacterium]
MKKTVNQYDVVIIGGGLVGMAAALSLAKNGFTIALIEANLPKKNTHSSYDDRTLVVNPASVDFWQSIDTWESVAGHCSQINRVHVSNKNHFGTVVFDREELNVDFLAYVIEARELGLKLLDQLKAHRRIKFIAPADLSSFKLENNLVSIHYHQDDQENQIQAKLMIAADGAQSSIRQKLGLASTIKNYQKTAIVCNITPELNHNNCAYERLTQHGPVALLPFKDRRCGFVWTVDATESANILSLSDEDFIKEAQQQFGYRLGVFKQAGKRSSYPLYQVSVPQQFKNQMLLMGNAAHSVSPISAQGLNLAVRGVARLSKTLQSCIENNIDIGSDQALLAYQNDSMNDQSTTLNYTDDLMTWFKIDQPIVNAFRSIGMCLIDNSQMAKEMLFNTAGGYRN